jgi:hypothetical protein
MADDIKPVLTDGEIDEIYSEVYGYPARNPEMRHRTARAIERVVLEKLEKSHTSVAHVNESATAVGRGKELRE